MKPPFRIVDGFIRRVWGKFGVEKVAMMENGVFVARSRTNEEIEKAMEACPIIFDSKPVIMKQWTPDLNLKDENIKQVPNG